MFYFKRWYFIKFHVVVPVLWIQNIMISRGKGKIFLSLLFNTVRLFSFPTFFQKKRFLIKIDPVSQALWFQRIEQIILLKLLHLSLLQKAEETN